MGSKAEAVYVLELLAKGLLALDHGCTFFLKQLVSQHSVLLLLFGNIHIIDVTWQSVSHACHIVITE